jgi:hypothetical protein
MRILRGTFHENIGYIYSSVLDYIEKVAHKERPGTITGFFNRMGLGIGLDAKGKFSSQGELLAFARNLKKVKAVNLPLK